MPSANSEIKIENVFIRVVSLRENKSSSNREENEQLGTDVSALQTGRLQIAEDQGVGDQDEKILRW